MHTTALIVAAGAGLRMGAELPKAFLDLAGRPLVEYSLRAFGFHPLVDAVILMAPAAMLEEATRISRRAPKVAAVAPGGARRQDTVRAGLDAVARSLPEGVAEEDAIVLVHDAARPLVEAGLITAVVEAAAISGAAVPGLRPADTVRRVGSGTLDRESLVLTQSPQGFRLTLLREAFAHGGGQDVTDDAALVELLGHPVTIVPGSPRNLKVTTRDDLDVAAALVRSTGKDR